MFHLVKHTQAERDGGSRERDRGVDLNGNPGGYPIRCSKLCVETLCNRRGELIGKTSIMGGSIFLCPVCQPI